MNIKINLKQLAALFAQSASNEELPEAIRQFAAQLTVLTAHVGRVESKINSETQTRDALAKNIDEQIAELATHILVAQPTPQEPAPTPVSAAPVEEQQVSGGDEEDEAEAMAEKVIRETEAEVAALSKSPPPQANGSKKVLVEEEAS